MPDRDTSLAIPGDILTALALLTRLPVRASHSRGAAAAWAYPLAGLAIGTIAAIVAFATSGLPPALTAGFALLALIIPTGALHEDGLADTADGFWGGWTRVRRLEIMKDSRIGTYGVLALVLSVGLRWAALTALAASGDLAVALILTAILSRAPMVALMHALPHARDTGLAASTGHPGRNTTLLALGIAAAIAALTLGLSALPLAILLILTTLITAAIAKTKIGGQTGDVLGAMQQISEIAILAFLVS